MSTTNIGYLEIEAQNERRVCKGTSTDCKWVQISWPENYILGYWTDFHWGWQTFIDNP